MIPSADLAHLNLLLPQDLEPNRPDLVQLEDDGDPYFFGSSAESVGAL